MTPRHTAALVAAVIAATLTVSASPATAWSNSPQCESVISTQSVCIIEGIEQHEVEHPADRVLGLWELPTGVVVFPVDGCGSWLDGWAMITAGTLEPSQCYEPLRFTAAGDSFCVQNNDAYGDQLCEPPSDDDEDIEDVPELSAPAAEYVERCGTRAVGVYGTEADPVLCWGDYVGGDLGGASDPWPAMRWQTFTDCWPTACWTYDRQPG